jgi:hypothetical protein
MLSVVVSDSLGLVNQIFNLLNIIKCGGRIVGRLVTCGGLVIRLLLIRNYLRPIANRPQVTRDAEKRLKTASYGRGSAVLL